MIAACGEEGKSDKKVHETLAIIPEPAVMMLTDGSFIFDSNTQFVVEDESEQKIAQLLITLLPGIEEKQIVNEAPTQNFVHFLSDPALEEEAYDLSITTSSIELKASAYNGFLYAVQTLHQLIPISDDPNAVPCLTIKDHPRFPWRGVMLDVSRHFFEKEYILKTIDRMALFKLNTLHLHLIDDQGWRIEIKKYPKLTEVGGFRVNQEHKHWNARTDNDPSEKGDFGGFYTQEDLKEIVAYAETRGITVMPEIEMPAHVTAAIAAYPEFSCREVPVAVPSGGLWPITDIYCPGKESTFEFLEDVMEEVMEIFPSKYIHVGGDEATRTNWESCSDCKNRMKEEGLENTEELQSYFIRRMERFLSSKGRVLIGWDEILEGGLAPGATVMSWRGFKGGWEASEQGHDVVMTPGDYVYLNQYQGDPDNEPIAFGGFVPLSKVYSFDPIVDSMSTEQKKHILGAQANLWSEFITDEEMSEYMLFPRLPALAEVLWTPLEKKDWASFSKKIRPLMDRLDHLGINYAKSAYAVTASSLLDTVKNDLTVSLECEMPDMEIRYSINNEKLDYQSTLYTKPFNIDKTSTLRTAVFQDGEAAGAMLNKTFNFHKAVGKPATYEPIYYSGYSGQGKKTLMNVIRGSKNFHDKQWLAWLVDDPEIVIDLETPMAISSVSVGVMENQGSGIYYPTSVKVSLSEDGQSFEEVGEYKRPFKNNGDTELDDFGISFSEREARWIKLKVDNLGHPPKGGDAWLFIDEITVE
jgi:hexosaminidase